MATPARVVVAGGGVAGLETLLALRALAAERVALSLVAPANTFVYRPVGVEKPFSVGPAREVALSTAAQAADAAFVNATIETVEHENRVATSSAGDRLEYDALVLAVGAEARPAVANALTWDDRAARELLEGLLRDAEQGYIRRIAVLIPSGPGWPLRGYELAILIKRDVSSVWGDVEVTLVRPDPPLLAELGEDAVERVSAELERAGVGVVSAPYFGVSRIDGALFVVLPSERLEVDRVVALPTLRGPSVAGIPADGQGFVDVDDQCRARGVDAVWAAGDCASFAVKSGGFAAEQADVVATGIAAASGAPLEPRTFTPRAELGGLPAACFLEQWLGEGTDRQALHVPTVGLPVLTYLERDFTGGWRG
jgi:sulfide:quinone oxidoreductase